MLFLAPIKLCRVDRILSDPEAALAARSGCVARGAVAAVQDRVTLPHNPLFGCVQTYLMVAQAWRLRAPVSGLSQSVKQ